MSWLRVLACGIPALFVKQGPESNLDDELRPHIEMLTEENHVEGMSSEEARYTARRVLSGIEQTKEIDPERGFRSLRQSCGTYGTLCARRVSRPAPLRPRC